MSTRTQNMEQPVIAAPQERLVPRDAKLPLQEILSKVQRDSQHEPQAYLEETEVPHGGE